MNFPDLETCKAIASEFPDSNFTWQEFSEIFAENRLIMIAKRSCLKEDNKAPAPTCEELGRWLYQAHYKEITEGSLTKSDEYAEILTTAFWDAFSSDNPSQKLAEAVKLILEQING